MLPNDVEKLEAEIRLRSDMLTSVRRTRELLLVRRREANDAATWMTLDKSIESNEETSAFLTAMLAVAQFKLESLRAAAGGKGNSNPPFPRADDSGWNPGEPPGPAWH